MRQKWESGCAPLQVTCAWIGALACIATVAWAPTTAHAQVPGETAIDDADETAEAEAFQPQTEAAATTTETGNAALDKELDEAEAAIEEMERQLEEAKRQMQLMGRKVAAEPVPVPGTDVGLVEVDGRAKKLQWSLNKDGTLYMRMLMWLQVWARAIQLNPGTEVVGNSDPWYGDVGLRRARLLWFGQIFPRTMILLHIGINNQTFRNARKPQVFFHDAWTEFHVTKNKALYIGAGLIYWNGISRQTNASTITLMSLDAPIMNWPIIERTDQFARQLGIYAKGKFGLFDYRIAVTRPFTPFEVSLNPGTPPDSAPVSNYRNTNTWAYSGYFMFQFKDIESNTLPYTVGTYIGSKKVFNLGFGFHAQPWAMQYLQDPADPTSSKARTLIIAAGDLFLDIPFAQDNPESPGAATWYGVYQYQGFGPNALRNIGIMNPGDAGTGTTIAGRGNAYPLIGSGHHVYSELGILIPGKLGPHIQFQPYVNYHVASFEALETAMHHFGVGLNMFVHRHNAKVTLEYRNRPIYNTSSNVTREGNSFILQLHFFI